MKMKIVTNLKAPKINSELTRLWEFAFQEAKSQGLQKRLAYAVLDPIGLYLNPTPCRSAEFEPLNTICFASGSGLSFSFLSDLATSPVECPVVMSARDEFGSPHVIVGESLHEFLSLGYYGGYTELDGLSYEEELRDDYINTLQKKKHKLSEQQTKLLARLRKELKLKPWKNVGARLGQLEKKWGPKVERS